MILRNLAGSQLKEGALAVTCLSLGYLTLRGGRLGLLPGLAPLRSMFDDPFGQGLFESDIISCLLGFDPFVL